MPIKPMLPRLVAVIVTYNAVPWIDQCFGSLFSGTYPVNVIAVDNGSSDATVEILRSRYPTIVVIEASRNLGFGQANNLGIDLALKKGADFLLLLNQDAWLLPDAAEKMIEGFSAMPDTWIMSPVHMDGTGKEPDLYFQRYLAEAGFLPDRFSGSRRRSVDRYLDLPFVNAAIWMLPASVIHRIGGFDPIFYHYGEDRHFAARVRHRQGCIRVDTYAVGCHDRLARISSVGLHPKPTLDREWVHFLTQACDPALRFPVWFSLKRAARHLLQALSYFARGSRRQSSLECKLGSRIVFSQGSILAARKRSRQAVLTVPSIPSLRAAGQPTSFDGQ